MSICQLYVKMRTNTHAGGGGARVWGGAGATVTACLFSFSSRVKSSRAYCDTCIVFDIAIYPFIWAIKHHTKYWIQRFVVSSTLFVINPLRTENYFIWRLWSRLAYKRFPQMAFTALSTGRCASCCGYSIQFNWILHSGNRNARRNDRHGDSENHFSDKFIHIVPKFRGAFSQWWGEARRDGHRKRTTTRKWTNKPIKEVHSFITAVSIEINLWHLLQFHAWRRNNEPVSWMAFRHYVTSATQMCRIKYINASSDWMFPYLNI